MYVLMSPSEQGDCDSSDLGDTTTSYFSCTILSLADFKNRDRCVNSEL